MVAARPLPHLGSIHLDARGGDRALRVSWHHESGLVVLSLWRENVCAGSFRLAVDEVPRLVEMLRAGLDTAYDAAVDIASGERLDEAADQAADQGVDRDAPRGADAPGTEPVRRVV